MALTTLRPCPACGRMAIACPTPCESKATARRIAACLFACEGLDTRALEAGHVRAALDAARDSLGSTTTRDEVEADTRLYAALEALGMAPQDVQEARGEAIAGSDAPEGG